jgi:hypothetical protein
MERRHWYSRNTIGHSYKPLFLTVTGVAAALTALYLTGGNEHAAARHPGVNTMPSYAVAPQQPGGDEKLLPPHATVSGQLVCQNIVLITHGDGSLEVIERPVLNKQSGVPYNLENLDSTGPTFERQKDAVDMTVYSLNGVKDGSGELTNCATEQVTATQVQDASNAASKPFVLTGPDSPTHTGDTVPITVSQAVAADYVAFDVTVNQQQLNYLLTDLQHQ